MLWKVKEVCLALQIPCLLCVMRLVGIWKVDCLLLWARLLGIAIIAHVSGLISPLFCVSQECCLLLFLHMGVRIPAPLYEMVRALYSCWEVEQLKLIPSISAGYCQLKYLNYFEKLEDFNVNQHTWLSYWRLGQGLQLHWTHVGTVFIGSDCAFFGRSSGSQFWISKIGPLNIYCAIFGYHN